MALTLPTDPIINATSTYQMTHNDSVVLANGTFNVLLYDAAGHIGRTVTVKNTGTGVITVVPAGAETIDGNASKALTQGKAVTAKSDGAGWWGTSDSGSLVELDNVTVVYDANNHIALNPDLNVTTLVCNSHSYSVQHPIGDSGSDITIDWNVGNARTITLNQDVVNLTFANGHAGAHYVLIMNQDTSGSRIVSWPLDVVWSGNVVPVLTNVAEGQDLVAFYFDGTHYIGAGSVSELNVRGSVHAYQVNDVVINSGVETLIQFAGESWDIGTFHDPVVNNSRVTVPAGQQGVYHVIASVNWAELFVGHGYVRIYVNGVQVGEDANVGANVPAPYSTPHITGMLLQLAVGDYVEIKCLALLNNSGGNITVYGGIARTFIQLARVA